MRRIEIQDGDRYGRLTIIREVPPKKCKCGQTIRRVLCKCDCGNTKVFLLPGLRSGHTSSCGCFRKEVTKNVLSKYPDLCHTKLYGVWSTMKQRCYDKNKEHYSCYGGRGITVCEEWRDDFLCFYNWAITNGYKEGLTIDRIDVDGNYEPSNCRWVTQKEQSNNRRNNIFLTHNNETHTIAEWSKILGINEGTLNNRRRMGWCDEKILTTKVKAKNHHKKYDGMSPIVSLDDNNNIIKHYKSIKEASRETGISSYIISSYLRGLTKTCHGYNFKYE